MVATSAPPPERLALALAVATVSSLALGAARAAEPGPAAPVEVAPVAASAGGAEPSAPASVDAPSPAQKRASYSLPWGLRPAIAPNLLRLDTVVAPADDGTTVASILTGGGKPIPGVPDLGFYGRVAFAHHTGETDDAAIVSNPLVGALYSPELAPGLRLAFFTGAAIPIGMGGGDTPDPAARATLGAASRARAGLDGVLFAPNYVGLVGGVDVAYLVSGLTFQIEGTLVGSLRARGEGADPESSRTAMTTGAHVGYLVAGLVTVSVEARAQFFVGDAAPVTANPDAREQLSVAGGARLNLELSPTILARPGVSYAAGLDAPMSDAHVHVLGVDLPVTF